MIALEFLAIISGLLMEVMTLQTGSIKPLTGWLTSRKTRARYFFSFLLWIGSLLYLVYAITWCFSSSLPVQASGLILIALSLVSLFCFKVIGNDGTLAVKREDGGKPLWFIQLDSTISMACILIVAVARIKGF